jgi:hypothetical protein
MNRDHPISAVGEHVLELDTYRAARQLDQLAIHREHVLRPFVSTGHSRRPRNQVHEVSCEQLLECVGVAGAERGVAATNQLEIVVGPTAQRGGGRGRDAVRRKSLSCVPDVSRQGEGPKRQAAAGTTHLVCSIRVATLSAMAGEHSRATTCSAKSIPLVTPPHVIRSPSSTTRSATTAAPVAARCSAATGCRCRCSRSPAGVGYDSEEAFSRAFKRERGESPSHWRAATQRLRREQPARPRAVASAGGSCLLDDTTS